MAVHPALDDTRLRDVAPEEAPTPPGRGRTALAVTLALVLAVSTAAAVLLWLRPGPLAADAAGLDRAESREEVMSVADQFLRRLGTYGPEMLAGSGEMGAYRDQVRAVITPKFAADFDKQVATVEQLVSQAGVARSTEVFATGVSTIDDDSARVLVAGTFSDSYLQPAGEKGEKGGKASGAKAEPVAQDPYPFRLLVDLVKVKGEWLVDDFSPAEAEPAAQDGAGVPAPGQTSPEQNGADR